MKKYPKLRKKGRRMMNKLKRNLFFNVVHTTAVNTCIPMQVAALESIRDGISRGDSLGSMFSSFAIVSFFVVYPLITCIYLYKNQDRILLEKDKFKITFLAKDNSTVLFISSSIFITTLFVGTNV